MALRWKERKKDLVFVFQKAIARILRKEKQEEFWDNLEEFLSDIIPPSRGSNWKMARKEQFQRLRSPASSLAGEVK